MSRYELRGQLGAGGMGTVYRVLDRMRGREVALKSLRAHGGSELYRFKREFRALADLAHPNLATLHELHAVGDEWMFTMELVEGVWFNHWVRDPDPQEEHAPSQDATVSLPMRARGTARRRVVPAGNSDALHE
ncbi:MAG TPA: protein kinase, partial [Myxococcota bacterium]|nr:protein kinase [Myxococcota bacterium]